MKRKATKYIAIGIPILFAQLVLEYLRNFLNSALDATTGGIYLSIAISMLLTVIVYYPAFNFVERYMKYASKQYAEGARKIKKSTFLGIVIGLVIVLLLFFVGFSEVWFQKNPMLDIRTM